MLYLLVFELTIILFVIFVVFVIFLLFELTIIIIVIFLLFELTIGSGQNFLSSNFFDGSIASSLSVAVTTKDPSTILASSSPKV